MAAADGKAALAGKINPGNKHREIIIYKCIRK